MAGGNRLFKTPDDLFKVFTQYKRDVEKQRSKWEKVQYVGKEGSRVTDGQKVPLTFQGFKRFCWDTNVGHVEQYFAKPDEYPLFVDVCARIKNEIAEDLITGGLLQFYHPMIVARLNGLTDKQEVHATGSMKILNIDPLDDSSDDKPA
jgi:hypothetical protein